MFIFFHISTPGILPLGFTIMPMCIYHRVPIMIISAGTTVIKVTASCTGHRVYAGLTGASAELDLG